MKEVLNAHERWLASGERSGARADLTGARLQGVDLSNANLRGAILRGAQLDDALLSGAQLIHADLTDAQLRGADLTAANLLLADFSAADLSGANLAGSVCDVEEGVGHVRRGPRFRDANLEAVNLEGSVLFRTDFTGANLHGARLRDAELEGANLAGCVLSGLDLGCANLQEADLHDADLSRASLVGCRLVAADLRGAVLSDADVQGADLQSASLEEAKVDGIRYSRQTRFRGIRAFSCYGSSRFRRFAQDQDYLEEFKAANPGYYWMWLLLTDCGRSMSRVVVWSALFISLFSVAYYLLGEAAFAMNDGLGWTLFTTTYYSVVTFTTLGFGDITPSTQLAAGVVMVEVIVGYLMLGILISILATKVARRS